MLAGRYLELPVLAPGIAIEHGMDEHVFDAGWLARWLYGCRDRCSSSATDAAASAELKLEASGRMQNSMVLYLHVCPWAGTRPEIAARDGEMRCDAASRPGTRRTNV